MRTLNATTLKGLWSAILSPWGGDGKIDQGILQRNCQKLAAAGVDGIYTTDSDGDTPASRLEPNHQVTPCLGLHDEFRGMQRAARLHHRL